ncbi:unnamed protein product [Caenorhabditis nigoni]
MGNCSLRKNHIEPEVRSNTADTKVPVQHIHDNKQVKASSLRKQYSDGDFCFCSYIWRKFALVNVFFSVERRRFLILLKPYTMNRHETKSNKKHPEIQSDFVTSYGDELGPPTRIFTVA